MKTFLLVVAAMVAAVYFLPGLLGAFIGLLVGLAGTLVAALLLGGLVFLVALVLFGSLFAGATAGAATVVLIAFSWLWPLLLLAALIWLGMQLLGGRRASY